MVENEKHILERLKTLLNWKTYRADDDRLAETLTEDAVPDIEDAISEIEGNYGQMFDMTEEIKDLEAIIKCQDIQIYDLEDELRCLKQ